MRMNIMMQEIRKADPAEIDMILEAAVARKRELYPQWEMVYIALPKNDPEERKRTLEWVWKDLNGDRRHTGQGSA